MHALLLHGVAVADGNCVIFECLMIDGEAVRCAYRVLSAIPSADGILILVIAFQIVLQFIHYFFRPYTCTNEHEFFSVAIENFFERSELFHRQLPELYVILTHLLGQDPLKLQQAEN